ncbi:uncharacterized protein L3040_001115 [Drepanopeziza brunnea f. sp. 'multigermtubi']|uniref:Cell wall protein, putative n=1 Tax=Marssonina brunnea f. sp. multigermtubi (strain MB_m1) TaxID=1072389 RepID=K1WWG2_MARBU|nr:cell wall protein, putative [Drepanopeziza brunnea f. sp. 'multigermtubi' MB_m1]EKD16832.1 cell wall protein, putative [Drepanopeziza brunnea f. sp. 'multigermtubi' MB_m1]KAJ5054853.1 hypothetical protein L3040_001115 [Drepanopeziza brunnea f. sp. 'multigermtubi']
MLSRPYLRLLSLLAVVFAVAQASWFDADIRAYEVGIVRRQASGASGAGTPVPDPTPTTTEEPVTTPPAPAPSTPEDTPTTPSTPASNPAASTPTSDPPTTPGSPTGDPESSSGPTSPGAPRTTATSTTTTAPRTTATPTLTTAVVINTVVVTISGSVVSSLQSSTVTSALPIATADLNSDGTKASSGMSTKTRNTIIGVVVGVGGAIILVGLGIVAFRIWGRKRNNEENDGLMSMGYVGNPGHEKTGSTSTPGTTNPFQSTLENYHDPARQGNVNASSNF